MLEHCGSHSDVELFLSLGFASNCRMLYHVLHNIIFYA